MSLADEAAPSAILICLSRPCAKGALPPSIYLLEGVYSGSVRSVLVSGLPHQARTHIHEALVLIQQLAYPYTVMFSHVFAAVAFLYRGEVRAVQTHADACHALATEQRNSPWAAGATMQRGWALAMQGQGEEGIVQMRQGLAAWRATGAETAVSSWLALLAGVYGNVGQTEAGLTAATGNKGKYRETTT
jgi:hypothetical protein